MMFTLCVVQNFVTLFLSMSDYLEESEIYQKKTTLVAWLVAIAVFLWFFMSIMIYWLFGFKYWVISIEVPRYLNGN